MRAMSDLLMMIYGSSATENFSQDDLIPLLKQAREKNQRLNITGLLLYHDGNFMQALEGEKEAVETLFGVIQQDTRHRSILTFLKRSIARREFSDWSMGFVNLGSVDATELPGYSDYLDVPLNSEKFSDEGFAVSFLRVFKQVVRS